MFIFPFINPEFTDDIDWLRGTVCSILFGLSLLWDLVIGLGSIITLVCSMPCFYNFWHIPVLLFSLWVIYLVILLCWEVHSQYMVHHPKPITSVEQKKINVIETRQE